MQKYLIFFSILIAMPLQAGWSIELINSSDGGYTSIALDSEGNPHVSHALLDLWYVHYDGSQWHLECLETEETSMHISLALDQLNHPHISYRYGMPGNYQLRYAYWNGFEWGKEVVDASDGGFTSIDLDDSGNPHIASQTSSGLLYARWTGSQWKKEIVDTDCWKEASSIALDNANFPHIAYVYMNDYLKLASWSGSQWNYVLIDSGYALACEKLSLVLDEDQNPQVAYVNSPDVMYAFYDGFQWQHEVVKQDCGVPLTSISMKLDATGVPHITCTDPATASVFYAFRDEGQWTTEFIEQGSGVSLALSDEGLARITFGMGIDGVKYAEEYETCIEHQNQEQFNFLEAAGPNPVVDILNLTLNLGNETRVDIAMYDLNGRAVFHRRFSGIGNGTELLKLDLDGIFPGIYLCRISSSNYSESRLVTVVR